MSVSVYINPTVCRYASLLSASSSLVSESRLACVLRWAAFHHRSRASPRSASSTMKPCSASCRRWYDVAPVLSRSCWASWVAVAGPSVRRSISIFRRVGCDSARSPAADGVIAEVAISATYLCKGTFANKTLQSPVVQRLPTGDQGEPIGCSQGDVAHRVEHRAGQGPEHGPTSSSGGHLALPRLVSWKGRERGCESAAHRLRKRCAETREMGTGQA